MKAPEKLEFDEVTFSDIGIFGVEGDYEYIRADLAELTWGDIEELFIILKETEQDSIKSGIVLYSSVFYQEVLRRFLESKKEVEL